MKIAIINNAANYLQFNINLGNYLTEFGNDVLFLNCDKYIKSQLKKTPPKKPQTIWWTKKRWPLHIQRTREL